MCLCCLCVPIPCYATPYLLYQHIPPSMSMVGIMLCMCSGNVLLDMLFSFKKKYQYTYIHTPARLPHFLCALWNDYKGVCRVVKKTVFFISCFFREKNMFFSCFFRFFRVFFLASDFFIFRDLTYNYCKLMMLFKTQTFLFD